MREKESREKQLTALLREKELGHLPGFVGRLGDLGSIAEQYDVAISTACPQLDFIVVDNMSTAKQCVLLLKQRSLGMATFLGLDKVCPHILYSVYLFDHDQILTCNCFFKMHEHLRNSQRRIDV